MNILLARWILCPLICLIGPGFLGMATQALAKNPGETEFRAAWVATVANIDWPSRKGLTTTELHQEIKAIVAKAKDVGLNALIVQVRPVADAIYPSSIEPWSEFLSGEQDRPPSCDEVDINRCAAFDPLALWIREGKAKGIQIHAWINPFRAGHPSETGKRSARHVSQQQPQIVLPYGRLLWMNPAEPAAVSQTLRVVEDLLTRYELAGLHIDDYFYPYPESINALQEDGSNKSIPVEFPDHSTWAQYENNGGPLNRANWRRKQVNELVETLHKTVKKIRPEARFGISPFGIGKPSLRPAGVSGFSQFDALFADVEFWMEQGWLDYLAPQLYWSIDSAQQGFSTLLDYWAGQNPKQKNIYVGLFTSRISNGGRSSWMSKEIIDQVKLVRERSADNQLLNGHIHFSLKAILENRDGIADQLKLLYSQDSK